MNQFDCVVSHLIIVSFHDMRGDVVCNVERQKNHSYCEFVCNDPCQKATCIVLLVSNDACQKLAE